MGAFVDTSVLVAAMIASERFHGSSRRLVASEKMSIYSHGLTETFSTITGGRPTFRLKPGKAADLLGEFAARLRLATLTPKEMLRAMRDCETRGVRGGAIFDYLHLAAARKANAETFYTLNDSHFRAFHRPGDPDIVHPG